MFRRRDSLLGLRQHYRVREEELVSILAHLSTLQLDEGVFEAAYFQDDSVKALQEIEDGKRASIGIKLVSTRFM